MAKKTDTEKTKPAGAPAGGKKSAKPAGGEAKAARKTTPEAAAPEVLPKDYRPRLYRLYRESIQQDLMKRFNLQNPMLVPRLTKIVLNVGAGTLHQDPKLAESIADELAVITGQKPVMTRARTSISNFKLRKGMVVGCRVTLRRWMMYEFLDRLISVAIPRIRDFRGLSERSFDGRGNYTFGVKEQIIFPEIDYDKVVKIHGLDITICTSAPSDEMAMALLAAFGFPFRRRAGAVEVEAA